MEGIIIDYHKYYILSFFNANRSTTSSQIFHVFQGKRTPSMFYLTERNNWHHAYAQFKKISEQAIDQIIEGFLQSKLITPKEKGFILTHKGSNLRDTFFEERYYPKISNFTNLNIRKSFWDRYQLFAQTFSEMSYRNNRYTPIIKHPHHQENVRLLFQQFSKDKKLLKETWVKEQFFLFGELDESRANILSMQLTGHQKIGKTKSQIQEHLNMAELEYFFYQQDSLQELLAIIHEHPKEAVISHTIMNQLQAETNYGLSISTYATFQLLEQGYSITEIASIRHLKENTIREHILELAFILYDFPFEAFVPVELYHSLNESFEKKHDYSYKEAKSDFKELEFSHYRLVELERMRMNG